MSSHGEALEMHERRASESQEKWRTLEQEMSRTKEERDRLEKERSEIQSSYLEAEEERRRVQADIETTLMKVVKLEAEHRELHRKYEETVLALERKTSGLVSREMELTSLQEKTRTTEKTTAVAFAKRVEVEKRWREEEETGKRLLEEEREKLMMMETAREKERVEMERRRIKREKEWSVESESAATTLLKAREEFSEMIQKNILFKSEMDVMRERCKSAETEAGRLQREVTALETRGEEVGVWAREKDDELRLCRQKLQSETVRRKQCLAESEKMHGQLVTMKEEKEETTLTCTKTEQERERLLTEKKMWIKERERMLRERRESERREEEESGWRERTTMEMATMEEKFISTTRREEEMTSRYHSKEIEWKRVSELLAALEKENKERRQSEMIGERDRSMLATKGECWWRSWVEEVGGGSGDGI